MANPAICLIDGCGKPHKAKGYCNRHYKRLLDHGSPDGRTPKMCSIPACGRPFYGKDWCRKHYDRWHRLGDPLAPLKRPANGEARDFLLDVVFNHNSDECLTWPFHRTDRGYGIITIDGKPQVVSRLVCERVNGPAPTSFHEAAHSCGKGDEGCVAKGHLSWKTPKENNADKVIHGTLLQGESHGSSKLKDADVLAIRAIAGTLPQREIAAMFNISHAQVVRIIHRKDWRHI